jgi:hypothetical protein
MEDYSKLPWFDASSTRQSATSALANARVGDFIVRPASKPGCLALSVRDANAVSGARDAYTLTHSHTQCTQHTHAHTNLSSQHSDRISVFLFASAVQGVIHAAMTQTPYGWQVDLGNTRSECFATVYELLFSLQPYIILDHQQQQQQQQQQTFQRQQSQVDWQQQQQQQQQLAYQQQQQQQQQYPDYQQQQQFIQQQQQLQQQQQRAAPNQALRNSGPGQLQNRQTQQQFQDQRRGVAGPGGAQISGAQSMAGGFGQMTSPPTMNRMQSQQLQVQQQQQQQQQQQRDPNDPIVKLQKGQIPREWKVLLKQAGVRPKDLRDYNTACTVYQVILDHFRQQEVVAAQRATSPTGGAGGEQPIAEARAAVYYFNMSRDEWEQVDGGLSRLELLHDAGANTFRVIGVAFGNDTMVVDSPLAASTVYEQPGETFHQWADARLTYGLNFATIEDAALFSQAFVKSVQQLRQPPPPPQRGQSQAPAPPQPGGFLPPPAPKFLPPPGAPPQQFQQQQQQQQFQQRQDDYDFEQGAQHVNDGAMFQPPPAPPMMSKAPPPPPMEASRVSEIEEAAEPPAGGLMAQLMAKKGGLKKVDPAATKSDGGGGGAGGDKGAPNLQLLLSKALDVRRVAVSKETDKDTEDDDWSE